MTFCLLSDVLVHLPSALKKPGMGLGPGDAYLSYLPLAHVYERSLQNVVFSVGGCVGFYGGVSCLHKERKAGDRDREAESHSLRVSGSLVPLHWSCTERDTCVYPPYVSICGLARRSAYVFGSLCLSSLVYLLLLCMLGGSLIYWGWFMSSFFPQDVTKLLDDVQTLQPAVFSR